MGAERYTYTQHENGTRGFRIPDAVRYATFFRVRLDWLLRNSGPMKDRQRIPVVGYVGAGAEVFPEEAHPKGRGIEMVDAPMDVTTECAALLVRGDSMYPQLLDGWLIFYRADQEGVPDECVGKLSVVKVFNGPTLVKILKKGSKPKLWHLESWNAPLRENQRVEWAGLVIGIRPR